MEEPELHKERFVYDYEIERRKRIIAKLILSLSSLIFFVSFFGGFNNFSELTYKFLLNSLGKTNEWSATLGPEWYVNLNNDISAVGGFVILSIFTITASGYFIIRKQEKRLWRFLFVIVGGGILLSIFKILFAPVLPDDPLLIVFSTISTYPSGHTMMSTIFYPTLAVLISRRQHSMKTKRYTLIIAYILVFIIGITRFLPGGHNLDEVLAGWSLGFIWICLCWFLERYIRSKRTEIS